MHNLSLEAERWDDQKVTMFRSIFQFRLLGKEQLENLARIYSVEEGKTVTFLELMRRGIQEKYQLEDEDKQ